MVIVIFSQVQGPMESPTGAQGKCSKTLENSYFAAVRWSR